MITRALKLKKGLEYVTANIKSLRNYELDDDDWSQIVEIGQFLAPFAFTTEHIEAFKYPTLSAVVPIYNKLMDTVEDWAKDPNRLQITRRAAETAAAKLLLYYEKTTQVYILATVMDPRLKIAYFKNNGWETGDERADGENLIETRIKPA